jgi:hypothetical protein
MTPNFSERFVVVRGHKVILDSDLAALYGVPTKRLNEQAGALMAASVLKSPCAIETSISVVRGRHLL